MTSILGMDISSVRLDACLLVDDQPPVLQHEILGKASEPLIERVRRVRWAVNNMAWRSERDGQDVLQYRPDWVVIEEPAGKYGTNALRAILGAITASIPSECQIGWRKASEWRSDLGAKNTKAAGVVAVTGLLQAWPNFPAYSLDEHELDAIGIALGWQRILASQATP